MTFADPASHARAVGDVLSRIDSDIDKGLPKAVSLLAGAAAGGGLIHVGGAGHSLAMVCETFYRAGGLACVRPLWRQDLLPLAGARRSSQVERTPGVGERVVNEASPAPPDVLVVFSTSGTNPYPIELALGGGEAGVPVIAVTSVRAAEGAVARAGSRLLDHADVVLDTAVPPGDVLCPPDSPRTAAVSTIAAAYLWSRLLAELDAVAERDGVELPRWRSANLPDGDQWNAALFERYGARIPELGTPESRTS